MKNLVAVLTTVLLLSADYNLSNAQVTQQWVQDITVSKMGAMVASSIALDGAGNVYFVRILLG